MVKITGVDKPSSAQKAGISVGDELVSINGYEINDILDYRFRITERKLKIIYIRREGDGGSSQELCAEIRKPEYDDIGLSFETFLMDEKRSCHNKCIFCFIDQNPMGMRDTVYFKDDDTRLSFLMGNYVTLTNADMKELSRIIEMHISPVNVSVHTTDPELRKMMLSNRFAGDILEKLKFLAAGGIALNCQIVLCCGINDDEHLKKTLYDLETLCPSLNSIAVVPAGLTKHRQKLFELKDFDRDSARRQIELIDGAAKEFKLRHETRLVYAADELYIKAGLALPDEDYYEGYPQLENGVGLIMSASCEIGAALESASVNIPYKTMRRVKLVTGKAAFDFMRSTAVLLEKEFHGLKIDIICAENRFFGEKVTVAGLLTGGDILYALLQSGTEGYDAVFFPAVALRSERDKFLDEMTPGEISEKLGVPLIAVENGADIVDKCAGLEQIICQNR
ncbi:hypothetical protein SDC9_92168 [bioreactor metagenome]|uniref:PDZ domain-containing protein n=1 Tax=bioreactor metagenome TaxID=1076179 RepID=A0A644ZZT2_9ZZZZ|nr:DUF512 domain-containing protein [Oscillospiraceae bacterium]